MAQEATAPGRLNLTGSLVLALGFTAVTLELRDAAGNLAVSAPWLIHVNRPPSVWVVSPANGTELDAGESTRVRVGSEDLDGDRVFLRAYLDGIEISNDSSFEWFFEAGEHTLRVVASDEIASSETYSVFLARVPPGAPTSSSVSHADEPFFALIIIVAFLGALLVRHEIAKRR